MKFSIAFAFVVVVVINAAAYSEVPEEMDWREKGAISKVKDQGNCEGTFYFAAAGVVESYYYILTGESLVLSEQSTLDCSLGYNNGCNGGGVLNTLDFIRTSGIDIEENYPYEGQLGSCRTNSANALFKTIGYEMLRRDEEEMKTVVGTIGPVAVSFDGSNLSSYTGGVYNDPSCNSNLQTHSGIIVGYGTTEDGQAYWTVKMPYGTSWGEDGYFRIARNSNACGIANTAIYPLL